MIDRLYVVAQLLEAGLTEYKKRRKYAPRSNLSPTEDALLTTLIEVRDELRILLATHERD